jgi:predicted phosphoribosyltransferase/dienelactone hydrolase
MVSSRSAKGSERLVQVRAGAHVLKGALALPPAATGVVLFAHGSGSGRFSPRNQFVADVLQNAGLATLLVDLLEEDEAESWDKVFDIELLAGRLEAAARWLRQGRDTGALPLGYFGASTGAAAALLAAASSRGAGAATVRAVVSRGGRPDLAWDHLSEVQTPTLLIVGGCDESVLQLNKAALRLLRCPKELAIVPEGAHLFAEPGALEEVASLAQAWFLRYLTAPEPATAPNREATLFLDREDAARRLARRLAGRPLRDPVVLAVPRGGVVSGAVLASSLGAELDVVLSRKLRAPYQPELAIGAVSEDGQVYLSPELQEALEALKDYVAEESRYQLAEIARRRQLFRGARPAARLTGRSVIVTDDGIATGSTMLAALRVVRAQKPHELIVAVPVASPDRIEEVRGECDEVVYLLAPKDLRAISQFYQDFAQVPDERVAQLLRELVPAASAGAAP